MSLKRDPEDHILEQNTQTAGAHKRSRTSSTDQRPAYTESMMLAAHEVTHNNTPIQDDHYEDNLTQNKSHDATTKGHTPLRLRSDVDIDVVLCNLALEDPETVAAKVLADDINVNVNVQAYAKLAGRNWTFYVQQLTVYIGRQAQEGTGPIDIDLGPDKLISRRHAVISYEPNTKSWTLRVLGRNGVKIDGVSLKSGSSKLRCGQVIEIGGTQMMFVLPDAQPLIASQYIPNEAILAAATAARVLASGHPDTNTRPFSAASGGLLAGSSVPTVDGNAYPVLIPQQPVISGPSYPNGVAMVSRGQLRGKEDNPLAQEDLSSDACKDIKPPFSYATMISKAILSSPTESASLAEIYAWISTNFAYYRSSKTGWQNSIRHNLSLNKAFEKTARKSNEPGKGCKWQITPERREEFLKKTFEGKMPSRRKSTASPTMNIAAQPAHPQPVAHSLAPNANIPSFPAQPYPIPNLMPTQMPPQMGYQAVPGFGKMLQYPQQFPVQQIQQHPMIPPPQYPLQAQFHQQQYMPPPPAPHAPSEQHSNISASLSGDSIYTSDESLDQSQTSVSMYPPMRISQLTPGVSTRSNSNANSSYQNSKTGDKGFGGMSTPQRRDQPILTSSIVRNIAGLDTERPYLDCLDMEFNVSPVRFGVSQAEAYTPERGSSRPQSHPNLSPSRQSRLTEADNRGIGESSNKQNGSKRSQADGAYAVDQHNMGIGNPSNTDRLSAVDTNSQGSAGVLANSPAIWRYVHLNSTPMKTEISPSRIREEITPEIGGIPLRF